MILISGAVGSKHLVDVIRDIPGAPPCELANLEFADLAFMGKGPNNQQVFVGIEYKLIPDVLDCIINGRFAGHQLPGLMESYDRVYLLVEGGHRPADNGSLLIRHNKWGGKYAPPHNGKRIWMYHDFHAWLLSMTNVAGVHVECTFDLAESIRRILTIYSWWEKGWDNHKSVEAINCATELALPFKLWSRSPEDAKKRLRQKVAMQFSDIGQGIGLRVAEHFGTVREMIDAPMDKWLEVEGIGKKIASKITSEIND